MAQTIQILKKEVFKDATAEKLRRQCAEILKIDTGALRHASVFIFDYILSEETLEAFGTNCLQDLITDEILVNQFWNDKAYKSLIAIAKLPGVTDDVADSAQMALEDFLNKPLNNATRQIFSQDLYYFENRLSTAQLQLIARTFLANPLIHHIEVFNDDRRVQYFQNPYVPYVKLDVDLTTGHIPLDLPDEELTTLSQKMMLALNLDEMRAIKNYFYNPKTIEKRGPHIDSPHPTDCELEILAQTWSEHCKHKEFNATIRFVNNDTGKTTTIRSLFKTFIKGATDVIQEHLKDNQNDWLIKVFSDNAGIVQATNDQLFVWKVETHNSPSALDPYGGAITGILGVNRDAMGTGIGGARLLFNTDVLCFGPPDYDKALLTGQLHPRQIMKGVIKGIEDGGNKSGIPTVNGAILFDERFAGKPLVYCGTGALMPTQMAGVNSWEKNIDEGDLIVMAGGRVGKDGIHGATFSSIELDEHSPMSAVQIGSPITQKKLADFMIRAAQEGLIKCSTDNGAGGLSSSIGELAEIPGGAIVHLEKVPLKYAGLQPWEIFVSESQERMTLVVEPGKWPALRTMAEAFEVEVSAIGEFNATGFLDVRYGEQCVAYLDMDFLHNGVPQKYMEAEWQSPAPAPVDTHQLSGLDFNRALPALLADWNIRSREEVIRQYDHEVQGRSILKPLMGNGQAPQDAAVVRLGFDTFEGIAVSNGIAPQYGDLDPYEMSCGAFDEAIRQIIAVGGALPNTRPNDGIFWSVNDNFCVPDSAFHPVNNPDGKTKLGQLVLMAQGLYDMATFFDIPLTSGKDSMKNDFKADGVKISVPPTILYSAAAKIPDVRRTISSDFKSAGDLIYQLGETYDEMGRSAFFTLQGTDAGVAPKVRKAFAKELYLKVMQANKEGLIASCHDLSNGGLAVALSECAMDAALGADIHLDTLGDWPDYVKLFSESHSRFVVSVKPENKTAFEAVMQGRAYHLGFVSESPVLNIKSAGQQLINQPLNQLFEAWTTPLL